MKVNSYFVKLYVNFNWYDSQNYGGKKGKIRSLFQNRSRIIHLAFKRSLAILK